ncbi:MAG: TonB family protein [Treponema sp.]|jgi:protein TonB|nr:TonB family protein [Treponema sp.]
MKKRAPKPLFFFLGASALIHGGILWLAPAWARPADSFRNQEPRLTLVDIPLPSPPQRASPQPAPPQAPVPPPSPETITEAPRETAPVYEEPAETQPPEANGFSGPPVSPAAVDPSLRENAISRYLAAIRSLIDQRKEYPYQARRQEQEGTILIRFTVTRQGTLAGEPVLEKKSRHARLNTSAIEAVKKAAPYPPFPGEIGEDEMSFQVAVSFSLK